MSVATTSERASAYAWANLNGRSNLIDFMKALGSGAVSYRRRISRLRGGRRSVMMQFGRPGSQVPEVSSTFGTLITAGPRRRQRAPIAALAPDHLQRPVPERQVLDP